MPSNSSVSSFQPEPAGGTFPPKAKPAVLVPAPESCDLARFKFPTSVQVVPSYFSVSALTGVAPPKTNPAV